MNAATPARSQSSLALRSLLGTAWFALWFFVLIPAGILHWSGESWSPQWGIHSALGATLITLAHVVLIAEIIAFIKWGRGTHVPLDPPTTLVTRGLYAKVRNPMYLAYIAIAAGEALLFRSWALSVYCLALAVLIQWYVVRIEEPDLRRRFGPEYDRFCTTSGRWHPRRADRGQRTMRG